MKILFVCLGNICRSPTAEAVFAKIVEDRKVADHNFVIDSAGTSAWHEGAAPDARSHMHAAKRGYELKGSSRQVKDSDYHDFDYIFAMDKKNEFDLTKEAPEGTEHKIKVITKYCKIHKPEVYELGVPDPYTKGEEGFELVLDLLEDSCSEVYNKITSKKEKI
jgi:protein-tyrosine phosphatase